MIHSIFDEALSLTKTELEPIVNNTPLWNEFFNTIIVRDVKNNTVVLGVKNLFAKQILSRDFSSQISELMNKHLNSNFNFVFQTIEEPIASLTNENRLYSRPNVKSNINRNYSFTNYIVGEFNKSAYSAAQIILKTTQYNPIFISGGVGLGKTHLLHAIGNEYVLLNPNKHVCYVSSDEFIREVYNALSQGGGAIENVKDKYQSYDLLLVDDIQFLSKKEKMNEIFFNIFNANISNNKIIVIASDKPPNYLDNFEERMKSRFESGLTIKIETPSLQTMLTILESKIKESGNKFVFSKDALNYLIHRNTRDIRRLEGGLHKILFYSVNNLPPGSIINLDIIKNNIENEASESWKMKGYDVDPLLIIDQVCRAYNMNPDLVKSKIRTKAVTRVRDVCMHALRNKCNLSFEQIGLIFSRHHTTTIEAIEKINKECKKNSDFNIFLLQLYKKI